VTVGLFKTRGFILAKSKDYDPQIAENEELE